jgi:hypothetical protein
MTCARQLPLCASEQGYVRRCPNLRSLLHTRPPSYSLLIEKSKDE